MPGVESSAAAVRVLLASVVVVGTALLLQRGTVGFGGEAASFSGDGGFGRAARRRRLRGTADQRHQAVERILAIAFLGAKASGGDDQDAILRQAPAGEARGPLAQFGRQAYGMREIEAQLNRGRHFVHVLPARAGGADKAFLDQAVVEDYIAYYRDHPAVQRGIVRRCANIALHAAWDGSVIEDDAVLGARRRCCSTVSAYLSGTVPRVNQEGTCPV
jgi:hypothetical protein